MPMTNLLDRLAQAEARAHTRYGLSGAVGQFGPLTAVYAGAALVLNSAWLGGPGVPSADELDAFEAFSRQHGEAPTIHMLSHAAPTLLPELEERGYALTSLPHLYTRNLDNLPPAPGMTICQEDDPDQWAEWSAQGFGGGLEIMRAVAQAPDTRLYTAWLDGQPAATAAMSLTDGLAALHGTSTLPAFRGRGAQTALLAWRLHQAVKADADLASVFVTPASPSERNIVRAGFVLTGFRLTFRQR
ncbi:GNAT family N-acetyltransferase [Deinococcus deserti]|uniref:N-acetyltransferase domain-containing protein n=1 Tax=Deinococcus deserti (strain DSM 17065 / CIP 109153 / LMG 22923 / VCD115) TaxID=546414 RepID=C1CXV5_DEIDV|nr:GNAT family N-acetyltransferase [Deinococcus deserti]ACO46911.2 hypothetical protein Deide_19190 [Deinococcus deserti VCD115]